MADASDVPMVSSETLLQPSTENNISVQPQQSRKKGRKTNTPIVDDEVRRSSRLKRGTSFQHIFIDGGSSNRPKVKVLGSSSLLQEEENKGQG